MTNPAGVRVYGKYEYVVKLTPEAYKHLQVICLVEGITKVKGLSDAVLAYRPPAYVKLGPDVTGALRAAARTGRRAMRR